MWKIRIKSWSVQRKILQYCNQIDKNGVKKYLEKINMEEVIRKYVDECWGFVQEHREYLMYVPSYEEHIEPEMRPQPYFADGKNDPSH